MKRTRNLRGAVLIVLIVLLVSAFASARFYTDVLWFREVGLTSVLWRSLGTQAITGIVAGIFVAAVVWLNLFICDRAAPSQALRYRVAGRNDPFERYRVMLLPYARWLRLGIAVTVGLFAGIGASTTWQRFLLWANRQEFGVRDPQFNKDVGFYVFEWPFYNGILDFVWFALIAALLLSVAAHLLYGAIRPEARLSGVLPAALAHVSVLLGLLALVKAAQYWLDQYGLNFSSRGTVTGASYTDVHAQLPALQLLTIISIVSAVLFLVNIRVKRIALPLAAVGIWILTAVLAGGLWPAAVQRFSVVPQEPQRERRYVSRNIAATRQAFGIANIENRPYQADPELTPDEVSASEHLLENVRLWDPEVLKRAYKQLQSIKPYYGFEDVDIDRYIVGGRPRQVLLSARELRQEDLPAQSRKWANLRLQFTHGFGIVASLAAASTEAGQPEFLVRNVPGEVDEEAAALNPDQPRLYYGEGFDSDEYSVVNTRQKEIDYPDGDQLQRNRYDGTGGIPAGGILRKVAFAIRNNMDYSLVLSTFVTSDSKILIYRNVRNRVLRAAPFLALDHDPYPAVVDGRVVWILDAYTSTPFYPYAQRYSAADIVGAAAPGTLSARVNYVRNSVKVVVDAYDGTMDFYIVEEDDPMIQAWRSAFPEVFTDEEPSAQLAAHFRYPEDLFKLQSEVYREYHVTDPGTFFAGENQWDIARVVRQVSDEPLPATPTPGLSQREEPLEPTYLLITLPGETQEEFVLTRPFTPRRRNIMVSFLVGRSDPGSYGELMTLEFPTGRPIEGPVQVNNLINQDPEISQQLSLLDVRGSRVIFGSLVILPIENSILYIQPLFLQAAEQEEGIPELKRVVLVSGQDIVMGDSLENALEQLFGIAEETEEPPEEPEEPDQPEGPGRGETARLIERAAALYERAQDALAGGDFEKYGRLIEQLGRVLERAREFSS